MRERLFYVGMLALGGWVAWMAIQKPPQVFSENSYIAPQPARQGSTVTVYWTVKNTAQDCPKSIQRYFYDANMQLVTTADASELSRAVVGDQQRTPRSFSLPPNLPKDGYYRARVCFECNLLQKLYPACLLTPYLTLQMAN